ncbi:MAG TPA: peptidylprolyl isomerase [Polyangiaceae bacterium]|nr:peptidylprolyl isomerase [Polyangiaceae bacterium]
MLSSCTSKAPAVVSDSPASGVDAPSSEVRGQSSPAPAPPEPVPYPRGRWRLAKTSDLDRAVLWFSHILIRHADSRPYVSFSLGYWASVPQHVERSRQDALVLATRLAEEAARDPKRFPELARQYSEDFSSRDVGGAVGGYPTSLFTLWPRVLDTLGALRPGQTSTVVETRYGFHVFYRAEPPVEEALSGEHILIGHAQAPWGQVFARNHEPTRSREEALALASSVYSQALANPEGWRQLVQDHSEHLDAIAGGDFGTWSSREPGAFPARINRLRELRVGEVGAPVETHLGFEIVRRTPLRARQQYRVNMLEFPVDDVNGDAPRDNAQARARAWEQASRAAQALAIDPSRFDEFGSGRITHWEEGRELHTLSTALGSVPIGKLTPEPVASEYGWLVAQRLDADAADANAAEPHAFQTELPSPERPDLPQFFHDISAQDVVTFMNSFARRLQGELGLSAEQAEQVRTIHDLGHRLDDIESLVTRRKVVEEAIAKTEQLVGDPELAARYRGSLEKAVASAILEQPADAPVDLGF